MIEKYGQTFKLLREDKRISTRKLEKLSEKANLSMRISASNISKFEREESNIGFPKIVSLLNVLNVPVSEYVMQVEELQDDVLDDFKGIREAYATDDTVRLNYLKKYYIENKDTLVRYEHLSILCDSLVKMINNEKVSSKDVNVIQTYLLNIDNWHYYEVTLFANMVFIFENDVIHLLLDRAVKLLEEYKGLSRARHEIALMLCNVILKFLENGHLKSAKKYIDLIYEYIEGSRYLYEKIKCDYLLGCYYYLIRDYDKGIKQAQQAVALMRQLELNKEAEAHEVYFNGLLKK